REVCLFIVCRDYDKCFHMLVPLFSVIMHSTCITLVDFAMLSNIYAVGNGKRETGIRDQGTGIREQGTGIREQGTGNREQGTGSRKQEAGLYRSQVFKIFTFPRSLFTDHGFNRSSSALINNHRQLERPQPPDYLPGQPR